MKTRISTLTKFQRGSTLLVAVVILLLASLMGLMAMNVGVFEQRSSGNDLRAKIVHQVAEAGLAQGFEYLMRANPQWMEDTRWESCAGVNMSKFPCTAVPSAQRDKMFRLSATGYTVDGLDAELTKHMLQLPAVLTGTGVQDVAYGVAPVLCRVSRPTNSNAINCAAGSLNLSDRRVVTFVSVAQIRGDTGRTTLTQTVASSSLLAQPTGAPTIVSSGTVSPPGNGDIVAMPDAAGPGLDVSVWSRLDFVAGGSFAACSRQDFLESGSVKLTDASWISDRTCASCGCGAKTGEGWDILDKEAGAESGTNKNVKAEEFPCDLFEYTFNVKAWTDTDGDGFCETRMPKVDFEAPNGSTYSLYPDEAFLYQYAAKIIPAGGNAIYVRTEQLASGDLTASSSGLIWCQVDCMPRNAAVGSVTAPVAVVADPGTNTPYAATLYGLLFYRSNGDGPLSAAMGGNAGMKFNAGSAVYGSVVVQGEIQSGSGGGLIFGDSEVLKVLASLGKMVRHDTLQGGWTDAYSY